MLAWPFHILLDFPFHAKSYFATPLFWPFSDFSIDGIPWSHWYIWYPNVAGLIILLLIPFGAIALFMNGGDDYNWQMLGVLVGVML